jgi:hypothetical protein
MRLAKRLFIPIVCAWIWLSEGVEACNLPVDGDIPAPGSSVVLRSRYLDPDDDCRFIPWTVKPLDSFS